MKVVSFEKADSMFDSGLSNSFQGGYENVLVVDGDLSLDGDFLEEIAKKAPSDAEYDLIAIKGDLTVKGRIASYDYTPGIFVSGHTRGETLEGGDCEVYVGNATIDYFVYGYYNDGILEAGSVEVPWVINSNHHLCVSAKEAVWVDNYGDDDDCSFGSSNIGDSFVPGVVSSDDDNEIDVDAFLEHLRSGKPVLRDGAMTAEQAAHADIERAYENKASTLDLRERKLKSFPARICDMTWLQRLDIGKNDLGELPEEIANLAALEELYVDSCKLAKLPAAIGALTNLRILSVAANGVYDFNRKPPLVPIVLPEEVGDLTGLEELDVSSLSAKLEADDDPLPPMTEYQLPESLGRLDRLRKITANETNVRFPASMRGTASLTELSLVGNSWAYLKELPDSVTTFSNLVHLDIRRNFFSEIPSEITGLTKLETLRLSGALARLTKPVPDLSPLSKLRVLHFNGSSSHTGVRKPSHEVLASLFTMTLPALEELSIDRWGKEGEYRMPLDVAVVADVGRFTSLRKLDLSFNGLKTLPESFYTLSLDELDLRYNAIRKDDRKRVMERNPKARIDLRNQRFAKGEEEQQEAVELSKLVTEANEHRSKKRYERAIESYDKALAEIAKGNVVSEYNQLYCHYGKAWVYSQLGYVDKTQPEDVVRDSRVAGVASSRRALELVPTMIWHFTDEGQFHREVLRFCGNFVAWELKEDASGADDPKLEQALELIEGAVACAEGAQHHYLIDTQVRVLLALGREADAFKAAHSVLRRNPDFADLADIKADANYQAWVAR